MNKRIIKVFVIIFALLLVSFVSIIIVSANNKPNYININYRDEINPTANFFALKENEEKVEEVLNDEDLEKYRKVCENSNLSLYLDTTNMGIAIYDKLAKYIWYSGYKNLTDVATTDVAKNSITSGVIIECYDSSTLNEATRYSANTKECKLSYDYLNDGFIAHVDFYTSGISFDVEIILSIDALEVNCKLDTLAEVPYKTPALKYAKEYKLKSVTIFPYFGSANYSINGYAFIPDGSGALVRFENKEYDTAYIKRVYGNDLGITKATNSTYLKNQNNITLPIYGINHGYNQAAFLVQIENGAGSSELNSYPYMYGNIRLNRTFFKFITREKFNIEMASATTGSITLINSDIYSNDYKLKYTFLNNSDANYVGMANTYKKNFILNNISKANVKLDVLAQDYKSGLFGKDYIEMTKYNDLLKIVKSLVSEDVTNISLNYIGYNNKGYVDNTLKKIKIDRNLGSKNDFKTLLDYLNDSNIKLSLYYNPMISVKGDLAKKTIKMQNLSIFEYTYKSSLEVNANYINPTYIYDYFTMNDKFIDDYNISSFTFDMLGSTSYSYRYKGDFISREEMIKQVVSEIVDVTNRVKLSLERPNDYLFNYISDYYNTNYESSKYSFITDSIPFISLLLSGHVNLYSSNINYVSNYDLYLLRLVEYNIYPSFMITYEDTNKLRYANFEYLYTTKFDDWNNKIVDSYNKVVGVLKNVEGCEMINHKVIDDGIVEVTYNNNYKIYINYTSSDYTYGSITIPQYSYIGGVA